MTATVERRFGSRLVRLTNLERVLWPRVGVTKRDLVDYYLAIAPVLVPHLRGRPLTFLRCPEGVEGAAFAQTECRGAPNWMPTATVELRDGSLRRHCLADEAAALAWIGNQSCVELHSFLARAPELERPMEIVLDLDPGAGVTAAETCRVALRARELLAEEGRDVFVKSSGASGLHLHVATAGEETYAETKRFARDWAEYLATADPQRVCADVRAERAGRVFVDWLRNDRASSTIRPYSPRALPLPTVATPLQWQEVERGADGDERALIHLAGDMRLRVESIGDLFAPLAGARMSG